MASLLKNYIIWAPLSCFCTTYMIWNTVNAFNLVYYLLWIVYANMDEERYAFFVF